MRKRFTTLVCLTLLGLSLAGCTKCGWIWDDLRGCYATPKPK
jgi:hypothetical protein